MIIEFRGFHPDKCGKQSIFINGEWVVGFWVFGNLLGDSTIIPKNQDFYLYDNTLEDADGMIAYEVIPETVGQFTDITDDNGTKIYKDDIVISSGTFESYPVYSLVEFYDGHFILKRGDEESSIQYCTNPDSFTQVITNIYEQPNWFDIN